MSSGVYILKKAGVPVYVGMGANVFNRLKVQGSAFDGMFDAAEVVICPTRSAAAEMEADLIEKHRPTFNRSANPLYDYPCGPDREAFNRYPHKD